MAAITAAILGSLAAAGAAIGGAATAAGGAIVGGLSALGTGVLGLGGAAGAATAAGLGTVGTAIVGGTAIAGVAGAGALIAGGITKAQAGNDSNTSSVSTAGSVVKALTLTELQAGNQNATNQNVLGNYTTNTSGSGSRSRLLNL